MTKLIVMQEVFESLQEAASAVLGDAQQKPNNNTTSHTANPPAIAATGSKIVGVTTFTSNQHGNGFVEVQSDFSCKQQNSSLVNIYPICRFEVIQFLV